MEKNIAMPHHSAPQKCHVCKHMKVFASFFPYFSSHLHHQFAAALFMHRYYFPVVPSQCATKCQWSHSGGLHGNLIEDTPSDPPPSCMAQLSHLISIFSLWWKIGGNCLDCQNNCTQICAHVC